MANLEALVADAIARVHAARPLPIAEPAPLAAADVARMIDHTLLKPDAVAEQILELCAQAQAHNFGAVCVQPVWAPLCVETLAESAVKVAAVCGFPQGATLPAVKAYEAAQLAALGVAEVDMVLNVGALKERNYRLVLEDIAGVADECHEAGAIVKVIIETSLLTDDEKVAACALAKEAGADFVKTSTGFGGGGATPADIALMRFVVGPTLGVKASGGVRSGVDALAVLAAGATRIGTSGGMKIVQELAGATEGSTGVRGDGY
jgi:deoxyribose-phosphate aldolase